MIMYFFQCHPTRMYSLMIPLLVLVAASWLRVVQGESVQGLIDGGSGGPSGRLLWESKHGYHAHEERSFNRGGLFVHSSSSSSPELVLKGIIGGAAQHLSYEPVTSASEMQATLSHFPDELKNETSEVREVSTNCVCVLARACPSSRIMTLNEKEEINRRKGSDSDVSQTKSSMTCATGEVCCKPMSWYISATHKRREAFSHRRRVETKHPFYEVLNEKTRPSNNSDLSLEPTEKINTIPQEKNASDEDRISEALPLPQMRNGGPFQQQRRDSASLNGSPEVSRDAQRHLEDERRNIVQSPQVIVRGSYPDYTPQVRGSGPPIIIGQAREQGPALTPRRNDEDYQQRFTPTPSLPPPPPLHPYLPSVDPVSHHSEENFPEAEHEMWQVRVIERIYDQHHSHCNRRSFTRFLCSGALLAPQWVLIPGHCYKSLPQDRLANVYVMLRSPRLRHMADDHQARRMDDRTHQSPSHGSMAVEDEDDLNEGIYMEAPIETTYFYSMKDTLENDIALLKLTKEFRHIPPLGILSPNMSSPEEIKRMNCVATGWGRNEHGGRYSTNLQKSKYSILDTSMCEAILRRKNLCPQDGLHGTLLCMGHEYTMRSSENVCHQFGCGLYTCHNGHQWNLVGLTASVFNCDLGQVPTLLTNVAHHKEWVDAVIAGRLEPGRFMNLDDGHMNTMMKRKGEEHGNMGNHTWYSMRKDRNQNRATGSGDGNKQFSRPVAVGRKSRSRGVQSTDGVKGLTGHFGNNAHQGTGGEYPLPIPMPMISYPGAMDPLPPSMVSYASRDNRDRVEEADPAVDEEAGFEKKRK